MYFSAATVRKYQEFLWENLMEFPRGGFPQRAKTQLELPPCCCSLISFCFRFSINTFSKTSVLSISTRLLSPSHEHQNLRLSSVHMPNFLTKILTSGLAICRINYLWNKLEHYFIPRDVFRGEPWEQWLPPLRENKRIRMSY